MNDIEEGAKELHRRKCHWHGIWDEDKISEYWLGCDRSNYRNKVRIQNMICPPTDTGSVT